MGNIRSKHLPFTKYLYGKIYQIVCNITGEIYVGSTITSLPKRLAVHKLGAKYGLKNCSSE